MRETIEDVSLFTTVNYVASSNEVHFPVYLLVT